MSRVLGKESPEPTLASLVSVRKAYEDACKEYEACLTTTEYGQTYLDPIKCKDMNFDPKKHSNEQIERIQKSSEILREIGKVKGWRAAFNDMLDARPKEFQVNCKKFKLTSVEPTYPSKKTRTDAKKQSRKSIHSSLAKAAKLVGHKINLGDVYVKVIAVKMNEDGVLLEVEEKVEAEQLEYYEIDYKEDMIAPVFEIQNKNFVRKLNFYAWSCAAICKECAEI